MQPIANHSSRTFRYAFLAGVVLLLGWCLSGATARQQDVSTGQTDAQNGGAPGVHTQFHPWFQFGRASWYGHTLQGQPTASGEAFDMNKMTCAHRSLPLGALVRVTNLRNHRSVVVRVNDRGPMPHSRIVDLSYAAAKVLRFRGIAHVRIDLIDPSPTSDEVARLSWPAPTPR